MGLFTKKLFAGKHYLCWEKYPFYGTCGEKGKLDYVLFRIPFTHLYLVSRCSAQAEMSDYIYQKALTIWPTVDRTHFVGYYPNSDTIKQDENVNAYYLDTLKWILRSKDKWECTKNPQVMFNETKQRYYGYSHRATQSFGLGDVLFDIDNENGALQLYYKNRKYQWKFIKTLLRSYFKKDDWEFQDIVNSGITCIVPFNKRGSIIIDKLPQAYQAAANFAKYVS